MKLHWSPKSPYVRKVMITAHELGLAEKIECVRSVAIRTTVNSEIVSDYPVGRIPALVLDDGLVLVNSFHICDYLNTLSDTRDLIPVTLTERWKTLQIHGFADGAIDTAILVNNELRKPEMHWQPGFINSATHKMNQTLDWFEGNCNRLSDHAYDIGDITLGVMLDYLDFRLDHLQWREDRPSLTQWHTNVFLPKRSSELTRIINDT